MEDDVEPLLDNQQTEVGVIGKFILGKTGKLEVVIFTIAMVVVLAVVVTPPTILTFSSSSLAFGNDSSPEKTANPWEKFQGSFHQVTNRCIPLSVESLALSECCSQLSWCNLNGAGVEKTSVTVNTMVGCQFHDVEHTLKKLKEYIDISPLSEECKEEIMDVFCHYTYRNCSKSGMEYDYCTVMNNSKCHIFWDFAHSLSDSSILNGNVNSTAHPERKKKKFKKVCLHMPECRESPKSYKTKCPAPFVSTNASDLAEPLLVPCSPKCFDPDWFGSLDTSVFQITCRISVALICFLAGLVLFTFLMVKELRKFPQCALIYMSNTSGLCCLALTLPFIWGQKAFFCSHKDAFNSWKYPTLTCTVQAAIMHFSFVSMMLWWLLSIANVLVSVWYLNGVNPLTKYTKTFWILEASIATGIPIGCVSAAFILEGGYINPGVLTLACSVSSQNNGFYWLTIAPMQVALTLGIILAYVIILRLQKSKKSYKIWIKQGTDRSWQTKVNEVFHNLFQRFLLHIILYPIVIGLIMSTLSYFYNYSIPKIVEDSFERYICLQETPANQSSECEKSIQSYHPLLFCVWISLLFDIFSIAVTVHVLSSKPAVAFWSKLIRRIRYLCIGKVFHLCCKKKKRRSRRQIHHPQSREANYSSAQMEYIDSSEYCDSIT